MAQDTDAARLFYSRISRVYDSLSDRDEHRAREVGLSLLAARPGERILEIGFGTGSSLIPMAAAVGASGAVAGIDISPGMHAVAQEHIRTAGVSAQVELTVGAVPPLPFEDTFFDAVFMAFTLELFPDDTIPIVLHEARRTLRAHGRVVVVSLAIGTEEQRGSLPERIYLWMHYHFPHIVDCRQIDVERQLADAGFTIARVERLEIWGLPVVIALAQPGPVR